MLKLPSLFKPVHYKRYGYKPRYWDEEKEKQEELRKERESVNADDRKNFREFAKSKWAKERKSSQKQSSARLVAILAALLAITYLLFRDAF